MTLDWTGITASVFHPIALIPGSSLNSRNLFGAAAWSWSHPVPQWSHQMWFPRLVSMLVGKLLILPTRRDLIHMLEWTHLLRQTIQMIKLTVWPISSDPILQQDFCSQLQDCRRGKGPATWKTYNSRIKRYKRWFKQCKCWCDRSKVDPLQASVGQVADFLTTVFNQGASARSVQACRTTVGAIHLGFGNGNIVSNSEVIHNLIEGMLHQRPPNQSVVPSWDLPLALQLLQDHA